MKDVCKFEMQIKKTGYFHCAANFGSYGWAYLWKHDGLRDPCEHCKIFTAGKPLVVDKELKSYEFWEKAGKMITMEDWDRITHIKKDEYV